VTAAGRFEAHVAVDGREFSYPFLVTATCRTPAETFGLEEKGTLDPATDARTDRIGYGHTQETVTA
jgi:dihydroorotase-like cyclic amidohydrolase